MSYATLKETRHANNNLMCSDITFSNTILHNIDYLNPIKSIFRLFPYEYILYKVAIKYMWLNSIEF